MGARTTSSRSTDKTPKSEAKPAKKAAAKAADPAPAKATTATPAAEKRRVEKAPAEKPRVEKAPAEKPRVEAVAAEKPAVEKPAARKKVAAPAPAEAVGLSDEHRQEYVAVAAYFIAERRGFAHGYEVEDWIEAEREIDRLLRAI